MTEEEKNARPHREMGILTFEEKKFLLAVERGDVASVRRYVQRHLYFIQVSGCGVRKDQGGQ